MSFASNTPVQFIPGIGARTATVLHDLDIHTVSELARMPEKVLVELFGPSIRSVLLMIGGTQKQFCVTRVQTDTWPQKQKTKSFVKRLQLAAQFVMML